MVIPEESKVRYMLSQNQKEVIQYIKNKVIDGYMLSDLKRIVDLPVIPNQAGNCNFPIVLYIFSCMEFLGTLVSETPIPDGPGATRDRVWAYIELNFGPHLQVFQQHRNTFVQIFRHGLTHEFFAKNAGVSRQHADLFGTSPGGKLVLDADRFYDVFGQSCERLKSLVDTSEEVARRVSERYLELQQRNREQWPSGSPVFTRTSGATGARQFTPDPSTTTPSFPSDDEA